MNSIIKNDFSGSAIPSQLPPITKNNEKRKTTNHHTKQMSFSELMISESDRSPCYIQRQRIKSVLNEFYKKIIIVGLLPDSLERHFINIFDDDVSSVIKVRLLNKLIYIIYIITSSIISYSLNIYQLLISISYSLLLEIP